MSEGTDIQVSPSRRHIIKRPRLTSLLDETKARCILLVAPAGYGKTTLAREWLAAVERPFVWYRATSTAVDPVSLMAGLAVAAKPKVPGLGERILERVRKMNGQHIGTDVLIDLLRVDLELWPESTCLVIDDYHYCCASDGSERLLAEIFRSQRVPLLIMSRRRPSWITPRELLYGEAHEIGTNSLAMTPQEASATLADAKKHEIAGLLALTKGWPALIGLAALVPRTRLLPDGPLPTTLYDYFADEVFSTLDEYLLDGVTKIALAPTVELQLAQRLLGRVEGLRVLKEGELLGFVTEDSKGTFVVHPLLRRFLAGRLRQQAPEAAGEVAEQIIGYYVNEGSWDDAYAVIARQGADRHLPQLIERAMYPLLRDGRLDTIRHWLHLAAQREITGPVIDLAEAEVAFREGHHQEAEILAVRAAEALSDGHPLFPRALIRAGQCAQFDDRPSDALAYQNRARARAISVPDQWDATWGSFVACLLLESDEIGVHLAALSLLPNITIDHVLRLKGAAYNHAQLAGGLVPVMEDIRAVWPLVRRSSDPVIASSFLNACAFGHVQVAQYDIAQAAADEELALGEELGLPFVRPHALCNLARAELGQHRYAEAEAHVSEVHAEAHRLGDVHNKMEACVIRACSSIFRGDYDSAIAATENHWERLPIPAQVGEYLAVRALALACGGSVRRARETLARSSKATERLAVTTMNAFTEVIISINSGADDIEASASRAIESMRYSGVADSLVIAYRGSPALLAVVRSMAEANTDTHRELEAIIQRAGDGARPGPVPPGEDMLTPREREVYGLLAKGYSNREIAEELFISVVTAKVHVRQILKKLGVRSRTHAAILRLTT